MVGEYGETQIVILVILGYSVQMRETYSQLKMD